MHRTAGIIIDDWKLSIFKKTLDKNGYKYEKVNGPMPGQVILKVEYTDLAKIKFLVAKMNRDAARSKMN